MAELTAPTDTTANSCCAPEAQATCCDPSAKAECCDPSHGDGCGCAADTTTTQASDVRERYAAAIQVTRENTQCPLSSGVYDNAAGDRHRPAVQWCERDLHRQRQAPVAA